MTEDSVPRMLLKQAEAVAQLRREVAQLGEQTTEAVANLITRVEAVEESATVAINGTATSWCWRYVGGSGAEALWAELTDWVAWIRHRYPLARRIPDCWPEHPEVVEELTALWLSWQAAYVERDAPLTAASEWHDRWLPGLLHRLEHGVFALDCAAQHKLRPSTTYSTPRA